MMIKDRQAQQLDLTIAAAHRVEDPNRRVRPDRSPVEVLARLVVAEHDRLCGSHEIALYCMARASCRQAAEILR